MDVLKVSLHMLDSKERCATLDFDHRLQREN
jgi:hypothetical protein